MEETRRAKGAGSIRQLANGKWEARLRYGTSPSGGQYSKKRICKSESEAKRVLNALIKEVNGQNGVETVKQTVEKFMLNWLTTVKKYELKPTSYDRLELTITKHICPKIGRIQISALTGQDIQRVLNEYYDDGKSYSTVKKIYDALHGCFAWAVLQRTIPYNPTDGVVIPGTKKAKERKRKSSDTVKFYTKEEQDALIKEATATYKNGTPIYRFGYAVPLLLNTGLRIGELLALQWKRDIDFAARTVSISHCVVMVRDRSKKEGFKLLDQDSTKSESGERILYLNDEALLALRELQKITGNFKYVISSKTGGIIHPSNIERMMRGACERAGFPKEKSYGPHALRHSFASNLFRNGVDVKVISELMGHSDIGITINTYIHLIEDQKKQAIVKIAER